jgi:hypothetical protein
LIVGWIHRWSWGPAFCSFDWFLLFVKLHGISNVFIATSLNELPTRSKYLKRSLLKNRPVQRSYCCKIFLSNLIINWIHSGRWLVCKSCLSELKNSQYTSGIGIITITHYYDWILCLFNRRWSTCITHLFILFSDKFWYLILLRFA